MLEQKAIVRRDTSVISQQEAMYLLKTIWKDAPETEVIKAAILCRQYNLNPLMGHIFLIKYDRYAGRGDQRRKVGEDWAIVRGIKAKRAMAQNKHRYSYADGPRVMTEEEQVKIFGEVEKDKIWAFVLLKDQNGNTYPGYGFWLRDAGVYGSDKGNSPRNMAFIRAEANALDKLEPGELPGMETVDESFIIGDFQEAIAEGEKQLIENTEQDIADYWPGDVKPEDQRPDTESLRKIRDTADKVIKGRETAEPLPERTESKNQGIAEETSGNLPEEQQTTVVKAGLFNLDDLTEKMKVAKFPEKTILSWLRSKANYQGLDFSGSFTDILSRMNKEQAGFLMKEIDDRASMR